MVRAVWLALVALLVAGAASAHAKGPIEMGDLFLVEQDGRWMCPNETPGTHVECPAMSSAEAAQRVIDDLRADPLGRKSRPLYLRVGKARNDCKKGRGCSTGVPAKKDCADPAAAGENPYCSLLALKSSGARLGVVVGAKAGNGKARRVSDLAWQACRIRQADGDRLYGFMFLDLAFALKEHLRDAVRRIQRGQVRKKGKWVPCQKKDRRWRLVTNDTTYPYKRSGATLATGAWAHAKHLGLLEGGDWRTRARKAARGRADALTAGDLAFVRDVRRLGSHPVLRFEVPSQSSRFAALDPKDQCSLLGRWASRQGDLSYTFLYALYVHGTGKKKGPYNSFEAGTFDWQRELIDRFVPKAKKTKVACPSGGGTPPPGQAPPGTGGGHASDVTCQRAVLKGWVNPHGSETAYHFEYWRKGDNPHKQTDAASAGAGTERKDVSSLVKDLRADTAYNARLLASNAGGNSRSEVFSFTTARRC